MKKKKITVLPGGVKNTPELKKLFKTDYLTYIKEYQRLLVAQTAAMA